VTVGAVWGCGKPQAANIALRKENQALRAELDQLRLQRQADQAQRLVQTTSGTPVQLDGLFTAHGLKFGRLTSAQGSELRVFVVPTDQTGDEIKAAGTFRVDAFDLGRGTEALVASWTFAAADAMRYWNGSGMLYGYVLLCPLPEPIRADSELTLRITFTDSLTGRTLKADTKAPARP
jgi:hypothetical protein